MYTKLGLGLGLGLDSTTKIPIPKVSEAVNLVSTPQILKAQISWEKGLGNISFWEIAYSGTHGSDTRIVESDTHTQELTGDPGTTISWKVRGRYVRYGKIYYSPWSSLQTTTLEPFPEIGNPSIGTVTCIDVDSATLELSHTGIIDKVSIEAFTTAPPLLIIPTFFVVGCPNSVTIDGFENGRTYSVSITPYRTVYGVDFSDDPVSTTLPFEYPPKK